MYDSLIELLFAYIPLTIHLVIESITRKSLQFNAFWLSDPPIPVWRGPEKIPRPPAHLGCASSGCGHQRLARASVEQSRQKRLQTPPSWGWGPVRFVRQPFPLLHSACNTRVALFHKRRKQHHLSALLAEISIVPVWSDHLKAAHSDGLIYLRTLRIHPEKWFPEKEFLNFERLRLSLYLRKSGWGSGSRWTSGRG